MLGGKRIQKLFKRCLKMALAADLPKITSRIMQQAIDDNNGDVQGALIDVKDEYPSDI